MIYQYDNSTDGDRTRPWSLVTTPPGQPLGTLSEFSAHGVGVTNASINTVEDMAMLTQTAIRSLPSKQPMKPSMPPTGTHSPAGTIEFMGAPMAFHRNAEIYGEGEPADYLYKVLSGTVRTSKVLADGRRQIGAFYLPGDIFGLESGDEHTFSAEAIVESKVLVIKRSALVALAARDNDVARQLWTLTSRELRRVQNLTLLLIHGPGTSYRLSPGNGRAALDRKRRRASNVAPGHCRLSRAHDRDRLAHAHAPGKRRRDRGAYLSQDRIAQSFRAEPAQRVSLAQVTVNETQPELKLDGGRS